MTNQSTMDKLIEMRLTTMADAFRNQLNDPKFKEVPFEDQFGMLVDIEYSSRKNNRLKRLIKNAGFDQPEANIMDINYTSGRKLNKELIRRLATCEYISEHRNLFITGATGCGKTYMACAFGMEACKQYYNTKYIRLPDQSLSVIPSMEPKRLRSRRTNLPESPSAGVAITEKLSFVSAAFLSAFSRMKPTILRPSSCASSDSP